MPQQQILKNNQKGQMTIFIALIFQVLFVFFAMIVNVGLIVHDKINLQNSVDLAAYYGAQRQAEVLDAIAHQNYEIRQAFKLLTWRVRVLGDLGNRNNPMQWGTNEANLPDVSIFRGENALGYPSVCISHEFWGSRSQNVCKSSHIEIPAIPKIHVIAPFLVWNILFNNELKDLRTAASQDCSTIGPLNQGMALRWIVAYRTQIARAKETIRTYAKNLSRNREDFQDLHGDSSAEGTLKTLTYNLTRANRAGLEPSGYKFFNSLGVTGDYKKWLHEVPIYPMLFYTNFQGVAGACNGKVVPLVPQPGNKASDLAAEPGQLDDLYHSVFGVEKNPWIMAYVGVYAETKPRKPYLPFGEPIVLKAKAYAKPFGGRIGPWYYKQWQLGADHSTGNDDNRTDPLAPTPITPEQADSLTPQQIRQSIPNYSRFPGDIYGLSSAAAITVFKKSLLSGRKQLDPAFYSSTPTGDDGLALTSEKRFNEQLSHLGYLGPWVREFEAAAVAPDLFDITYYSIHPDSYDAFTKYGVSGTHVLFPPGKIPYDFGSFGNMVVGVEKQIQISNDLASPNSGQNFYLVKDPQQLLTGWAPSGPFEYNFPSEVFQKCNKRGQIAIGSGCAQGGRSGYSVKIISENYLKSQDLNLGGNNIKGPIQNPPPF